MIFRYCFSFTSEYSVAYDDTQYNQKTGTGFLILPNCLRLRDYKNQIRPEQGVNNYTISELLKKTKRFSENEKFFCSFDRREESSRKSRLEQVYW